uniref:LFRYamide n=1 Tax=Mizuhopecten yessoensis TaxID=6573 RepID=A0A346GAU6_MIZYE|nr:LFRYamide [Mizuhopecten yessoensis]
MTTLQSLCVVALLLCLCEHTVARSIECSTLCTQGYSITSCECWRFKVKLPFRFGKRGRLPFRYGKRDSPVISSYDSSIEKPSYEDALDLLRSFSSDDY